MFIYQRERKDTLLQDRWMSENMLVLLQNKQLAHVIKILESLKTAQNICI